MANGPALYPLCTRPHFLIGSARLRTTREATFLYPKKWVGFAFLSLSIYLVLPQASSCGQADNDQLLKQGTGLTVSCTASPTKVRLGEAVTVTASADGSDIVYGFGSSVGTLIVKGNSATLNTAGISKTPAVINVVCSATNLKGQTIQTTTQVIISTPPVPAGMTATGVEVTDKPTNKGFDLRATVAPTLSWTTGTQTQTIAGGSTLLSAVRSNSYCDPDMRQFGIAANASDTSTTKAGASTINLDNNDVRVDATRAIASRNYLGIDADFFGNNSLGVGLQQIYAVEYQFYLRNCSNGSDTSEHRAFASLGLGGGFMNQRLYAMQSKLNAAVLPLSAQFSYLLGESSGKPPRLILFGLFGYLPVLTDMHAYQLSAIAGLQIPTRFPWLTFTLTETDLYMNNAPTRFKRNYQNGSVAVAFTLPPNPPKVANPAIPDSVKGACYGGDKLARLYCYDDVTIDSCAPPCLFRPGQRCSSSGAVPITSQ